MSPETISNITESAMADIREWQNWSLKKSYQILFFKNLCVVLAINWEGRKEILVLWLADAEDAKFWTDVSD